MCLLLMEHSAAANIIVNINEARYNVSHLSVTTTATAADVSVDNLTNSEVY